MQVGLKETDMKIKSLFMDFITVSGKNQIHPPFRSTGGGAVVISAVIALLSIVMAMPQRIGLWTVAAFALLTICGTVSRSVQAVHLSLFGLLWVTLPRMFSAFQSWPFSLLIPLVVYGIIVAALPPLRILSAGFDAAEWRLISSNSC